MGRKWTTKELETLKKLWNVLDRADLARYLNRSVSSINNVACRCGLSGSEEFPNRGKKWTALDDRKLDFLLANDVSMNDISKVLKRPKYAIRRRARERGVNEYQ